MLDFEKPVKTPRLYRDITVTEKIDGSNAVIGIAREPDGHYTFQAGTKAGWLSHWNDHHGLWHWMSNNLQTLLNDLGTGLHRGEWFGRGIHRNYGLEAHHFALFNTAKWDQVTFATPGLCSVPILYQGPFDLEAVDESLEYLRETGSVLVPGFHNPEGVCVYHSQANISFKVLLDRDHLAKGQL